MNAHYLPHHIESHLTYSERISSSFTRNIFLGHQSFSRENSTSDTPACYRRTINNPSVYVLIYIDLGEDIVGVPIRNNNTKGD